jgi:hypothetical protein
MSKEKTVQVSDTTMLNSYSKAYSKNIYASPFEKGLSFKSCCLKVPLGGI